MKDLALQGFFIDAPVACILHLAMLLELLSPWMNTIGDGRARGTAVRLATDAREGAAACLARDAGRTLCSKEDGRLLQSACVPNKTEHPAPLTGCRLIAP